MVCLSFSGPAFSVSPPSLRCWPTRNPQPRREANGKQQQQPKKKKKGGTGNGVAVRGKPLIIGLSHKMATVEVREKLSIQEAHWNEASAVGLSPHVSAGPVTSGDGLRHCASSRPLTAPGVSTTTG